MTSLAGWNTDCIPHLQIKDIYIRVCTEQERQCYIVLPADFIQRITLFDGMGNPIAILIIHLTHCLTGTAWEKWSVRAG